MADAVLVVVEGVVERQRGPAGHPEDDIDAGGEHGVAHHLAAGTRRARGCGGTVGGLAVDCGHVVGLLKSRGRRCRRICWGEARRRRLGGVSVGYRDRVNLSARNHPACPAERPSRFVTRLRRAPDRPTRQTLQPVGSGATFGCENPPAHTISGSLGVLGRPTPPRQRLCVVCIVPWSRGRRD